MRLERRERVRFHSVLLPLQGRHALEAADAVGRRRRFVQLWGYAYRDGGIEAVRGRTARGRQQRLLPEQEAGFVQRVTPQTRHHWGAGERSRTGPRGPGGKVPRLTRGSSAGNGGESAIGRAIVRGSSSRPPAWAARERTLLPSRLMATKENQRHCSWRRGRRGAALAADARTW